MADIEDILRNAETALAASLNDDPRKRLEGMIAFMRSFEALAKEINLAHGSWDSLMPWASSMVDRVRAARPALGDWQIELGDLFYSPTSNEEEIEAALDRRSQHGFAREVFKGTPVDDLLAQFEDAEFDEDLRNRSEDFGYYAPSYVPPSHTWWRRPSE